MICTTLLRSEQSFHASETANCVYSPAPMKDARFAVAILFCALTAGCHRHHHARHAEVVVTDNGSAPPAAVNPAPAVDNRNAGQVVVDILAQQGYTCTPEETRWSCTVPNDPSWPFYVSYVTQDDQSIVIWLDSYAFRAFGHPCEQYTNHMNDLAVPGDGFAASCDDSSQQFRMNTALQYNNLDVPSWTQNHLGHRATSLDLLKKAHAIRK